MNNRALDSFVFNRFDFNRIWQNFNAQVSCRNIAKELNAISGSKKWCMEFTCDDNDPTGWVIGGELDNIRAIYLSPPANEIQSGIR